MTKSTNRANTLLGIGLVLLSAVGLATQNIISKVFFIPVLLFDRFPSGGWLTPQFSNIVLLLALRMALMTILLASLAPRLYPATFLELRQLPHQRKLLSCIVGSGLCLFVGLTSLYFALSQVAAGTAIATFFIYPAVTVLLAWRFLHRRPHPYQLALTTVIFAGILLTTLAPAATPDADPLLGTIGALAAGLSFGLYGIFAEVSLQPQSTRKAIHPVPFSLVTFAVVAVSAIATLPLMKAIDISSSSWPPILITTVLSAVVTVIAYVLNNTGIRYIGASLTALISASTPALTTLFAWAALQEALRSTQRVGISLVTLSVAVLSLRRG
ncbi:MAG: DMT family transporter [Phormidesmis sp.]